MCSELSRVADMGELFAACGFALVLVLASIAACVRVNSPELVVNFQDLSLRSMTSGC